MPLISRPFPITGEGNDYDLLIIGAGISGLSMAHSAAAAGLKVLILEQERQAGGCLHSHRFSGELDGFWLELGAHSVSIPTAICWRCWRRRGRWIDCGPAPRWVSVCWPTGWCAAFPLNCIFPNCLLAPFRLLGLKKAGRSVADYFGRIVGPRNYATVFEPAFNAVICQPAGEFPAECLFNPRPRRKDFPRSFTIAGGLQTIAEALANDLPVQYGQTVQATQQTDEGFSIATDDGEYRARSLCLATPAAEAARLLQHDFPELSAALAQIQTAWVESVGVAIPKASLKISPVAGLIGRNAAFYSVVSRDTVPDPAWRGFTFHFRPGALDESGKLDCIARILGLPRQELTNVVSKTNQLPALRVGQSDLIGAVDRALAGTRLALTGNYFTGVAIEDCVTRSRTEWERLRRECG
jgi:oxygen-dependent protoporphyrinogen oxidase